jgi:hypothetical protein
MAKKKKKQKEKDLPVEFQTKKVSYELIELPAFVKDWCRQELKGKDRLRVDVNVYEDKDYTKLIGKHGLNFGSDMKFTNPDRSYSLSIDEYIIRMLKFSRKYIKIYINEVLLTDINLPVPLLLPSTIDLSQT